MTVSSETEHEEFHAWLEKHYANIDNQDPLRKSRTHAWEKYQLLGLPTRRNEVFRSIKLRALFSQAYEFSKPSSQSKTTSKKYITHPSSTLVFINGYYQPDLSNTADIPNKVVISSLNDATRTYSAFLTNQQTRSLKDEEDPFAALNAALHPQGIFIYVPPKTHVETPIQILSIVDHGTTALLIPRLQIFLGTEASAKFHLKTIIATNSIYGINQVTDLSLDDGAHAEVIQTAENETASGWRLDALRAHLKKDCLLKTVNFTHGSMTTRHDYRVTLAGENSEANLNGLWILKDKREAHTNVLISHEAPHTRSNQLFKGVLYDISRSSFEGKIFVDQIAQKTEAFQLNSNLLLNERASADSKPNLEIFADDVKASHGSTIGRLNPEHLFYLKTRGLQESEAKTLLVQGFCREILDQIPQ